MKTLFTMGFGQNYFGGFSPVRPYLGADQSVDLDSLRQSLSRAEEQQAAINQWIQNRPDYQTILGPDLARWNGLISSAADSASDATNVEQRISSSDSSLWTMTPSEKNNTFNWINTVDLLYKMSLAHPELKPKTVSTAAPGAPGAVPGPGASTGPNPLIIGAGAAAAVGLLALALK